MIKPQQLNLASALLCALALHLAALAWIPVPLPALLPDQKQYAPLQIRLAQPKPHRALTSTSSIELPLYQGRISSFLASSQPAPTPEPESLSAASLRSALDYYWPKPQLSQAPLLQTAAPSALYQLSLQPLQGELHGIIVVYINEYGQVDRVVAESGNLPDDVLALLAEQFRQTRYQPGEIERRPVKSRIRIAIDSSPLDASQIASAPLSRQQY